MTTKKEIIMGRLYERKPKMDSILPTYLYPIEMEDEDFVRCLKVDNPYNPDRPYALTKIRFMEAYDLYELVSDV